LVDAPSASFSCPALHDLLVAVVKKCGSKHVVASGAFFYLAVHSVFCELKAQILNQMLGLWWHCIEMLPLCIFKRTLPLKVNNQHPHRY
jgi:hypothetical protein